MIEAVSEIEGISREEAARRLQRKAIDEVRQLGYKNHDGPAEQNLAAVDLATSPPAVLTRVLGECPAEPWRSQPWRTAALAVDRATRAIGPEAILEMWEQSRVDAPDFASVSSSRQVESRDRAQLLAWDAMDAISETAWLLAPARELTRAASGRDRLVLGDPSLSGGGSSLL